MYDGGNVFNDDVLATLSNRDTSIIIYNPDGDVVFSNGNVPDGGMPNFSKTENHVLRVETSRGKIHMKIRYSSFISWIFINIARNLRHFLNWLHYTINY